MKTRIKINGFIVFVAFSLLVIFPSAFIRQKSPVSLDAILEACGIAFILLGQLVRVCARGYKAEHSGDGKCLVKSGPYAFSRNPMYLGILLIGTGVVLTLFQWWAMTLFLVFFITRYIPLMFNEEQKLRRAFPEEYPPYQQSTPRVIPSLARILKTDVSEYLPLKLSWIKKEIGAIAAVLLAALFIESWEDIKDKGLAGYFKESAVYFIIIALFIWAAVYLSRRACNETNKS